MCGIAGFINLKKDKKITYNDYTLLTQVFSELQDRGTHASGYAILDGNNIISEKLPLKSSEFINTPQWLKVAEQNIDTIILHTRWYTKGKAEQNQNNHPFISTCGRFTMVHNGILYDISMRRTNNIKEDLLIETDTYVFMQLFEKLFSESPEESVLNILKQTIEKTDGNFAILFIDKQERKLYTFRSTDRPIEVYKGNDSIWFCSTDDIFTNGFKGAFCPKEKIKIIGISNKVNIIYEYDIDIEDKTDLCKTIQLEFKKLTTTYTGYAQSFNNYPVVQNDHRMTMSNRSPYGDRYNDEYDDEYSYWPSTKKEITTTDTKTTNQSVNCPKCNGEGVEYKSESEDVWECNLCNGAGDISLEKYEEYVKIIDTNSYDENNDFKNNNEQECLVCDGTGIIENRVCTVCNGNKTLDIKTVEEVDIEYYAG